MKTGLIIEFEEGHDPIIFTREQLERLLECKEDVWGSEYRCKVCGTPMAESFSEGSFVNSYLETSRWEEYRGIQPIRGYPRYCIVYNDVFGWDEHQPEMI